MSKKTKDQAVVLSALEQDLLELLYDRTLYGAEFVTAIKEASRGTRDLGFGSLYPTLTRLERNKLVTWRWGDEESGPRRKYYDITPSGRAALEETWRFRRALRERPIETGSETVPQGDRSEAEESAALVSVTSTDS